MQHGGVIEPFTSTVPEAELEALRSRLRATRWPEAETDPSQGVALGELQELCEYWCDGYDWRRCEARLEQIGQFQTEIDGLGIYFLHARSPRAEAFPLILTHGWPGSVIEFLDALQPLTDAGFHCVVPSLPGYGFSAKPAAPGWGVERIARAWATLMARLGYDRYVAQGSDWGTSVSASLGQQDPQHVVGIHLMPPLVPLAGTRVADREQRADEAGYSMQQRTRPQTIGYSLTDSPAGLAAWITEKVGSWTDPRSEITRDAMLDNIMLYWLPRAGASSRGCTGRACPTSTAGLWGHSSRGTSSMPPPAARSSPTSCSAHRESKRSGGSRISATGTSPSSAATSPRGSNPSFSRTR